jgi:hypothetical protein
MDNTMKGRRPVKEEAEVFLVRNNASGGSSFSTVINSPPPSAPADQSPLYAAEHKHFQSFPTSCSSVLY